ncbi:hypothetical protein FZEAL_6054 [Fusarium zealandicum]|uniref:Amidoligase n=1 Tax=Fusarium zealandicum TaxID=1053134 RepID=A0A8H4UIP0_9HYPO|nr:hypothetical protein FZEAL_6054 [Fusarium zealandicum]
MTTKTEKRNNLKPAETIPDQGSAVPWTRQKSEKGDTSPPNEPHMPSSVEGAKGDDNEMADPKAQGSDPMNTVPGLDSSKPRDEFTRPPRVSFGVELEFLIAVMPGNEIDADQEVAGDLAPLLSWRDDLLPSIVKVLMSNGIAAHYGSDLDNINGRPDPANDSWTVKTDGSVKEEAEGSGYEWENVEVVSPASYACDEAFGIVSTVIRLITSNFRTRVNTTCGFHVHVGNGRHRMDMRALRNYAALFAAAEPMLSTLHCPSRSSCSWAASNRRFKRSHLSQGMTAARYLQEIDPESRWVARYLGRERKLGETAVASRQKLRKLVENIKNDKDDQGHLLEPDWASDDSDWEAESKPFSRPRKVKGPRQSIGATPDLENLRFADIETELDNESITRQLAPQVHFPTSILEAPSSPLERSAQLQPFPGQERRRTKQMPIEDIISNDAILDRYRSNVSGPSRIKQLKQNAVPECKLTWPAVTELLSCDVGVHQLAWLMGPMRELGSNWLGQGEANMVPGAQPYYYTVESRYAGGSMDAEWIVMWAKMQCRLLEWARDADPSTLMSVIAKLARDDHSKPEQGCTYDAVDLLKDLGMYTEVKQAEQRLERGEEAWFDCMLLLEYGNEKEPTPQRFDNDDQEDVAEDEDERMMRETVWPDI